MSATAEAMDRDLSVLSTLNPDGSRRWIRPRPSRGRFWRRRRVVAYALIALFTLLPYLQINGRPAVQLDITNRVFSLLGAVFYPTDTLLLALLFLTVFVTIFLLTALAGRLWCGWACPQTVYMEFLFRPIERLFEGEPGRKTRRAAWRKPAKYAVYLLLSMYLAHTFLAYFVGVEALREWVTTSPAKHPTAFLVMAITTGLMMFDFCFFREQTCLVACPYGRFQSVMLDRNSLIVTYDARRGEPRGRKKRRKGDAAGDVSLNVLPEASGAEAGGDCIDCFKCVTTCPTGIDIRDGLQMECIHCTQCIDACDDVMDKIGRPRGLIRYGSQAAIEGGKRQLLRPRVVLYPLILAVLVSAFTFVVATRQPAEVTVLRGPGSPFVRMVEHGQDRIASPLKMRVRNRTASPVDYTFALLGEPGGRIQLAEDPLRVEPFALRTEPVTVILAPESYGTSGRREITVRVHGSDGFATEVRYGLMGPTFASGSEVNREPNTPTAQQDGGGPESAGARDGS